MWSVRCMTPTRQCSIELLFVGEHEWRAFKYVKREEIIETYYLVLLFLRGLSHVMSLLAALNFNFKWNLSLKAIGGSRAILVAAPPPRIQK